MTDFLDLAQAAQEASTVKPVMADDFLEQAQAAQAEMPQTFKRPKDTRDFLREFESQDYVPFMGAARQARKTYNVYDAAKKQANGEKLTAREQARLDEYLEDAQRGGTFGYDVAETLAPVPAYMAEFLMSGGASSIARGSAKKLLGKAAQEATEDAVARMTVGRALGRAADVTADVALRTAATEAMQQPFGGSRIEAEAWSRALGEFEVSKDEAGELAIVAGQKIPEFLDHLAPAAVSALAETAGELSGGAILGGLRALQPAILKGWLAKNTGATMSDATKALQAAGFHGMLLEVGEERVSGALRALAGTTPALRGDFKGWEEIFPGWRQIAVEMAAFSVPGAAGALAGKVAGPITPANSEDIEGAQSVGEPAVDEQTDAPSGQLANEPKAGPEQSGQGGQSGQSRPDADPPAPPAPPAPGGEAPATARDAEPIVPGAGLSPEQRAADIEAFGAVNRAVVEEHKPEKGSWEAREQARLASKGIDLVFVQSEEKLKHGGWAPRAGTIVVDAGQPAPERIVLHELVHDLAVSNKATGGIGYQRFLDEVQGLDPEGLQVARERVQELREDFDEMSAGLREEEALAVYAEYELASYFEYLKSDVGALRAFVEKSEEKPGVLRRLVDWLLERLGKGAALRRQLEPLRKFEGGKLSVPKAKAALALRRALDEVSKAPAKKKAKKSQSRKPAVSPKDGDRLQAAAQRATTRVRELSEFEADEGWVRGRFRRWGQDDQIHHRAFLEYIERNKQEGDKGVNQDENSYDLATLAVGEMGHHARKVERLFKRIEDEMRKHSKLRGKKFNKALGDYLYALHNKEAIDDLIAKQEAGVEGLADFKFDHEENSPTGMSMTEAREIIASVDPGVEKSAKHVAAMREYILSEVMLKSGLISQEQHDSWSRFEHYVPLRSVEAEFDGPLKSGKGFSVSGRESEMRGGRRSKADNPWTFMRLQAARSIERAANNRVGRAFWQLLEDNPSMASFERLERPEGISHKEWKAMQPEGSISFKLDGEEHVIDIKSKMLARALRRAGNIHLGPIAGMAGRLTRPLAQLVTSYNPEFWVRNFLKDAQTAAVNLGALVDKDASLKGIEARVGKNTIPAVRAVLRYVREKPGKGRLDGYTEEAAKAGMMTGYIDLRSFDQLEKLANRNFSRSRGMFAPILTMNQAVEDLNTAIENGVRLATYAELRDKGWSPNRAAAAGKNLTVNFNRRGEWGTAINSWFMFFNAGVQGSHTMLKAFKDSTRVRKRTAAIVSFAFALNWLSAMWGDEDENGVSAVDAIPEHRALRAIHVVKPGGTDSYTIPLPYGYSVPYTLGRVLSAAVRRQAGVGHGMDPGDAALSVAFSTIDSFSPLGDPTVSPWQAIMPTVADPFVQMTENKTFYGGPIYPFRYPDDKSPDSQQSFGSTPQLAKSVAEGVNSLTFGDYATPGLVDVSPESYEHLYKFATGGIGTFAERVWKMTNVVSGDRDFHVSDTPFLRDLYYTSNGAFTRDIYYSNRETMDLAKSRAKEYEERGDRERARKVRSEHADILSFEGDYKAADKKLKGMRDEKKGKPTKEQQAIDERMRAEMARLNRRFIARSRGTQPSGR